MAKIAVGISADEATAIIQADSTEKGALIPRMTTTQRDAISSPPESLLIYNTTTDQFEHFDGSSWVATGAGSGDVTGPASATDNAIARFDGTGGKTLQNSGPTIDDSGNLSLQGQELRNFTEQIVTANTGASYEIDWSVGTLFELTLTDSPTFTFANLAAGRPITVVLIQDGTGSRTVTWPASVDWPGGTAPTLTTTASAVDVITLFVRADGSTVLGFESGLDMQ